MHTPSINVNVTNTSDSIRRDLQNAGIAAGDALIVHSSMKSLGPVEGGPEAVVSALIDAVSPGGTVLMPVFSQPQQDPIFDPPNTPSHVGLITETFRRRDGVRRSLHPTHSVAAIGQHAEWLDGHESISGLSAGSPLHRAAEAGAKILMLGCPITSCSAVHIAEAILHVPYLGKVWYDGYGQTLHLRRPDGTLQPIPPIDPPTCSDGFAVVERELDRRGQIERVRVAQATCLLFRAADVIDAAVQLLKHDAAALLCDHPRCPVCPRARHLLGVAK